MQINVILKMKLNIFKDSNLTSIDYPTLKENLKLIFGSKIEVEIKEEFIPLFFKNREDFNKYIQDYLVKNIRTPLNPNSETKPVDEDANLIQFYDGNLILKNIFSLMKQEIYDDRDALNVIFIDFLIGTWDLSSKKYHLRTSILSNLSIISIPGLIHAPARPRDYYLMKEMYKKHNFDLEEVELKFSGKFLTENDVRLTEVSTGMVLQAISFNLDGESFCENKNCRLFNAHWQADLIHSQIENKKLCLYHQNKIKELVQSGN